MVNAIILNVNSKINKELIYLDSSAQIVVAQKYVSLTLKKDSIVSDVIIATVIDAQKELEKANMQNISVIVKQIVVTGKYSEKLTIVLDLMQIVTIKSEPEPKSRLEVFK